jgi:3-methyladenine DNA glycosylase Tag
MAIPEQIDPTCLNDYFEILTKAVFQAGVSWALVDKKWPAFRRAFADFNTAKVAVFSEADVERLMQDEGILRSQKKILGTIKNAQMLLELEEQCGTFKNYLHSKSSYEELSKDMRKRFKFLGELSVYYLLFRVKEPVPDFDHWLTTIEGHHPRMQEMVDLAKTTSAGKKK